MTEREIVRLRKKFILLSTLSFFGVMLLMGGCIYLFSSITIGNEARRIMTRIAENNGELAEFDEDIQIPEESAGKEPDDTEAFDDISIWDLNNIFGVGNVFGNIPDYYYTTRYFAVLFDEDNTVESVKTTHINYIDEKKAEDYGRIMLKRGRSFGRYSRYYYLVYDRNDGGSVVVCLDRSNQITIANRIIFAVLVLLCVGTILAFMLMRVFSRRFVKSEMENVEKQKQFITNVSHELKTPLAVIRANTEMQEVLEGESEWTQSTLRQVDRMDTLIKNLVKISKSRETEDGALQDTVISGAVKETAESFAPVAAGEGKTMEIRVADGVQVRADDSRIRQLTTILTDNAVKYCDEGGKVTVVLERSGKSAVLTVSNDYAEGKDVDYSRFFERFYRQDEARTIAGGAGGHNSGYGIGLSIADNLVKSLKGSIKVSWKAGVITFTCRF